MGDFATINKTLPADAEPAMEIVRALHAAGHVALLAGGCVRDLLRNETPHDFDVATDARPERVCELFRATRRVGAQFGVVLVRRRGRWVEVATFRSDGEYHDGRRPASVTYCDAEQDAQRRDFTINGMFLDPLEQRVIDYVGGRRDLQAGCIRAIGQPAKRFGEDYLRLLRAVRFSARLDFEIEPETRTAMYDARSSLSKVAPERIHDELDRMLRHPHRCAAIGLLRDTGLLEHLWPGATWVDEALARALTLIARLPENAGFELSWAVLLGDRPPREVDDICRRLACSNARRVAVTWLVENQSTLDAPADISLAALKRLLSVASFGALRAWARARYADMCDGAERSRILSRRIDSIPAERIAPPPLVTGSDLLAIGVAPGPVFKRVLDDIYTRQLDEEVTTRAEALSAARALLAR